MDSRARWSRFRSLTIASAFALATATRAIAEPPQPSLGEPLVLTTHPRAPVVSLEEAPIATRLHLTLPLRSAPYRTAPVTHPVLVRVDLAKPPDRVGIGHTWNLGGGREFVLDLTPSPTHCAPLAGVTF